MGLSRPPAPARLRMSQIIRNFVVAKEQGHEAGRPYVRSALNISLIALEPKHKEQPPSFPP